MFKLNQNSGLQVVLTQSQRKNLAGLLFLRIKTEVIKLSFYRT
jgi:hypothetical protein